MLDKRPPRGLMTMAVCLALLAPVTAVASGATPSNPVITDVSTSRFSRCGGDRVTITGNSFAPRAQAGVASSVELFSQGTVLRRSSTRITMRTPRRPAIGRAYVYVYQMVDGVVSTDSVPVRLTDNICPATPPVGFREEIFPGMVQVFWRAPRDTGGQSVVAYRIQEKIDGVWSTTIPTWPRADVRWVSGGSPSSVVFRVAAIGSNGLRGEWSAPYTADVPVN